MTAETVVFILFKIYPDILMIQYESQTISLICDREVTI